MPELDLYQTEIDELEIVKAAFVEGCRMVVDSNYQTPVAPVLETVQEFQFARSTERHFFLINTKFERMPISMRQISKDGKSVYYISPSQGGPFIEFLGGGIYEDKSSGVKTVRSGFLAYRPDYWNDELTEKFAAPVELVETYRRLAKVVRATSTRIKPDKAVYWLGNDAKAQLQMGTKLGLHQNWTLPRPTDH
jgi:hypothetical protein